MLTKNLQVLALLIAFCGAAHAQEGGDGGQLELVAYEGGYEASESSAGQPMTCSEVRSTAWFQRELARSDGDVSPDIGFGTCGNDLLAETATDIE